MASASRRESASVSEQLFQHPQRFDFFQAVRLLERIADERAQDEPGYRRWPVGEDHAPQKEVVRFRALPSHRFPPTSISALHRTTAAGPDEAEPPPEMVVTLMGMTGPSGVLPQHYTQLIIDRIRRKDYALRDFLDLFHHRTISQLFRAWEKYRFPFAYERTALQSEGRQEDAFTGGLYCLVGWGAAALRNRLEVSDESFLYYAGHFAHYPRTARGLHCLVEDYFGLPTEVLQFYGQWLYLSREDQSSLPSAVDSNGANNRLGVNVVVGERVWGVENKFRLRLGRLGYEQFRRFTPQGDLLVPLCQLVRAYVGPDLDFDIQLVLKAQEVPPCRLERARADAPHLGWNTWLCSQPLARDADDAIFSNEGQPIGSPGRKP
jgi:type VI secretion system protein ImpH